MKNSLYLLILLLAAMAGCLTNDNTQFRTSDPNEILLAMLSELPTVSSARHTEITAGSNHFDAIEVKTRHYTIYTTVTDRLILRRLPMLLESAWQNFQLFGDMVGQSQNKPGEVYYFQNRDQWLVFTNALAGDNASVFAQIQSGAYCYENICVAWQISRQADFSVLTHEAWHQYCGLNFKEPLPSWLAESSATYLESYQWDADGLVFSPRYNTNRLGSLRISMAAGVNFSLEQLIGSDPGAVINDIANLDKEKAELIISGYYARLYALSRFCFEYEYGIYRKDYLAIFADAYAGTLPLPAQIKNADEQWQKTRLWNMQAGTSLFNHYFGEHKAIIEEQYQSFCVKLASSVRIVR